MAEQAYRTEPDSMGAVRVLLAPYYGAEKQRAVENFPVRWRRRSWLRKTSPECSTRGR